MAHDNSIFDSNDSYMELSYELLYLLQWLIQNETGSLKKILNDAIKKGFLAKLPYDGSHQKSIGANAHNQLEEFFTTLEILLLEVLEENEQIQTWEKSLTPALKKIDPAGCDVGLLRSSIEKTNFYLKDHDHENPKDILFKELLKRWRPKKNQVPN